MQGSKVYKISWREEYISLHLNGETSRSGNRLDKINKSLSSIGLRDCKNLSIERKFLVSPKVFVPSPGSNSSPLLLAVSAIILLAFCRVLSSSIFRENRDVE